MEAFVLMAQLSGTLPCLKSGTCEMYGRGVTVGTGAPMPHCDDGWVLVTYPGTAIAMCAKELKPAQR